MAEFQSRVKDITEYLLAEAGKNPTEDRYYCGYIAGANDFIKTEFEESQ